jgi:hypothetical protein
MATPPGDLHASRLDPRMELTANHRRSHPRLRPAEACAAVIIVPAGVLLGLLATSSVAVDVVGFLIAVLVCVIGVQRRWGTAICVAPVFIFPVTVITDLPSAGSIHWRLILAVLSALLATAYWSQGGGRPRLNSWSFAAVGFLSIALLMLGARTHASIQNSLSLALFAYSGLIVGQCLRRPAAIKAITVLAVPLAILAIAEAAGLKNVWSSLLHANAYLATASAADAARSTASFGHPLIAGACLTATGLLSLSLRERAMTVCGIICIFGALTTVSRSALLAGAAGLAIFILQSHGRRVRIVAAVAVLAVVVLAVINAVPTLHRSFDKRIAGLTESQLAKQETVRSNSLSIFENEVNVDPSRLLIGGGVEYSIQVLTARGGNAEGYDIFDNEYITMMYDGGLFVVLAIFGLLTCAAVVSSSIARRNALPALAAVIVVMYFVDGMEWPSLSFVAWMVIGLFTVPLPRGHSRPIPAHVVPSAS